MYLNVHPGTCNPELSVLGWPTGLPLDLQNASVSWKGHKVSVDPSLAPFTLNPTYLSSLIHGSGPI